MERGEGVKACGSRVGEGNALVELCHEFRIEYVQPLRTTRLRATGVWFGTELVSSLFPSAPFRRVIARPLTLVGMIAFPRSICSVKQIIIMAEGPISRYTFVVAVMTVKHD